MKRPWLIAHRGASGEAPESTAAAIRRAVESRVDMIELDVQLTRDGRLIIFHDDRLERTTTGRGRVSRQPYRALAKLDAGAWFAPAFQGERILLMSQALRLIPRRCRVNLELKRTPRRAQLVRQFVLGVQRAGAASRVLASSFDAGLIRRLRRAAPQLATALICARLPQLALRRAVSFGCLALHPRAPLITSTLVDRVHVAGLRVHAWTVDRPAQARALLRLGVDGIVTNVPSRLRSLVA